MRVVITSEHRFAMTPDGTVYSVTGGREYGFWQRYLDVFDGVTVVARVDQMDETAGGSGAATGPGLDFLSLPAYRGLMGYATNLPRMVRRLRRRGHKDAAYILRVPGAVGGLLADSLRRRHHPYGVEVVGDPGGVFAPGVVTHPLAPLIRWWSVRDLRRQCAGASAAAYVTASVLQQHYPSSPSAFATHYSDGAVATADFAATPLTSFPRASRADVLTIVTVGSLAQPYKGIDVLIDAMALCARDGLGLLLLVVGDGRYRTELEARAAGYELSQRVCFLGQLPAGEAVRRQLDRADLFVLPSRTEGLPRAMIEAMARALPCLGTAVGGIPDLLESEDLMPPNDPVALATKLTQVTGDPARMAVMSARNLAKAREYREEVLQARRITFYSALQERTAQWRAR